MLQFVPYLSSHIRIRIRYPRGLSENKATCGLTLAVFPDACDARIPCAQNHRIATGLRERRAPWVCGCTTATAGGLDSNPWADGRYSKLWSESARLLPFQVLGPL